MLYYELLKIFKKKIIILLIPLLLIGNIIIYHHQQYKTNGYIIENIEQYQVYEDQFSDMSIEKAHSSAKERRDRLDGYQTYLLVQQHRDSELMIHFEANENYIKYGSQYVSSEYAKDEALLARHIHFNMVVLDQLEALISYTNYIPEIENQANDMLQYSIFNDEHSFAYRNILKTKDDYEHLQSVPLKLDLDYGVVSSTTFYVTDVLMLVVIHMLCLIIFVSEREQGQMLLLRTMRHGRVKLFNRKLLLLIGLTLLAAIIFYGTVIFSGYRLYGLGDGMRYIQSIGAFKFAHLQLTVWQYLLLFILGKMLICCLLSIIFSYILLSFNHISKAYILLTLLLGLSYMAYYFIHPQSSINILKYVNVIAFYDVSRLLTNYVNLNLVGYPIRSGAITMIVILLLYLLLIYYSRHLFLKSFTEVKSIWSRFSGVLTQVTAPFSATVSLAAHEYLKQLFSSKGWIVVLISLLIGINDLTQTSFSMDIDRYYYNEYMKILSGPMSDEKTTFLEQQLKEFNEAAHTSRLSETDYRSGKISLEQYNLIQGELADLSIRDKAFRQIYSQYEYLLHTKETRYIDVHFVNQYSTHYLFNNENRDYTNAIVIGLLVTLYCSSSFTMDTRNQFYNVQRTTKRGRLRLFSTKLLCGLAAALLMLLFIYLPQYVNTIRHYPAMEWNAPIQSIQQYGLLQSQLTLKQLCVIVSLFQILSVIAVTVLIMLLSQCLKKSSLTILAGVVLVVCPALISWLGYRDAAFYSWHYPQVIYVLLEQQGAFEVILYVMFLLLFIGIGLLLSWKSYIDKQLFGV